jgi:hypothetical protein
MNHNDWVILRWILNDWTVKSVDTFKLADVRSQRPTPVSKVMDLRVEYKVRNFLTIRRTISFME